MACRVHRARLLAPLTLGALLVACGRDQAVREQATRVSLAIEALVAAGPHAKASPLAALAATTCSVPEVCAARQACLDAFAPQVQAAERQREARTLLDRHDPALTRQIDAMLDEVERLHGQASQQQERCLVTTTTLRQTQRL